MMHQLPVAHNNSSRSWKGWCPRTFTLVIAFGLAMGAPSAPAQTFTLLHTFPNPGYPSGTIIEVGGLIYGTTFFGGRGYGTVFSLDPTTGKQTVLHKFNGLLDGQYPADGVVVQGKYLYGTTESGGGLPQGAGTVFKVDTTNSNETISFSFLQGNNGATPYTGVVLDPEGNIYGTTLYGPLGTGGGIVFKLTQAGNETSLFTFANTAQGFYPESSLIRDAAGNLYGTTYRGGDLNCNPIGCGTIYKLDPSGNETILHSFTGLDGKFPTAALIQDAAGSFHGTTTQGGLFNAGTIFKLDSTGTETVLYNFTGAADGSDIWAPLIRDAAGNLYGTAAVGGTFNYGTVFKLNTSGKLTVLHTFTGSDGANPFGGLVRDAAGILYGTAQRGGAFNNGTLFKITP